jgi:hypothetical protein
MRRGILALGAAFLVASAATPSAEAADYYRVNIRRLDKDLYRDTMSRVLIKTKYCYEYAYGEDAVLVWDGPYSWDNKLIFSSGSTCDVDGVYRG